MPAEAGGTGPPGPPAELLRLGLVSRLGLRAMSAVVVLFYRLLRRGRVQFGHHVLANHRLSIRGPGRVIVEDRANLYSFGGKTRLVTRRGEATIRIGRNARLNGPLLQADTLIEVGPDCIVGQAHLLDTDMHSVSLDRRTNPGARVRTAPIVLERNVWVARGAAILPGVRVGEGSVIAYGAVVTDDVPPRTVAGGNPARVLRSIE
jgi:acetyltransferase-like isoleucine patch superfamily enzyme